ncbi:MAG: hypothetical protein JNM81_11835 [Rhodospirillaceae bacterium]|nr:hypothetical protein [Rhodospirillaceae bacterium]
MTPRYDAKRQAAAAKGTEGNMITISFLEDIDGEPTPSAHNDRVLDARHAAGYKALGCNELGPADPRYFMPPDAVQRDALMLGLQPAATPPAQKTQAPPAFTIIANGRLLNEIDDGRIPRYATHPWAA